MNKTIIITVRGGIVHDVSNVPRGWDYEIQDLDNLEAEAEENPAAEPEKLFLVSYHYRDGEHEYTETMLYRGTTPALEREIRSQLNDTVADQDFPPAITLTYENQRATEPEDYVWSWARTIRRSFLP